MTHPKIDAKSSKHTLVSHIQKHHLTAFTARNTSGAPFTGLSIRWLREVHDWLDRDSEIDKTPRQISAIMGDKIVVCTNPVPDPVFGGLRPCGNDLWIESPRSLDYYNYSCSKCGHKISPMTETGASR